MLIITQEYQTHEWGHVQKAKRQDQTLESRKITAGSNYYKRGVLLGITGDGNKGRDAKKILVLVF